MPRKSRSSSHTVEVEVAPAEVDAGGELTLKCKVSCVPAVDLSGRTLLIKDQDGVSVRRIELVDFDGEASETSEFAERAPVEPGGYTWQAVLPADDNPDAPQAEASAPFSFNVKPHDMRILVWDAPSAIQSGEKFSIKLGVKCSSECPSDGWAVEVRDHDGEARAEAELSDQPRPGTSALYCTDVDLDAPVTEGLYAWEARTRAPRPGIAHAESVTGFSVRVVPKPECHLTVLAIDRESRAPVQGAKVVVHPYKTLTDERGVAEVKIPKGQYRLFVSGKNYFPFRSDGVANADATIEAELAVDSEPSDADLWS